ncbi:MAG: AMP-binding protein, partial [bacterium]|nr:AMP-binding protein [bacterium]
IMFAYNPGTVRDEEEEENSYDYGYDISKFDLTLTAAAESEAGIDFNLEYCTRLFTRDTAGRFIGYFRRIVAAVCADPAITTGHIAIIGEEEKQLILQVFNDTAVDYPREVMVPELFQQQSERTPDGVALKFGHSQLTYAQLNRRADGLAAQLRDRAVVSNSIVAVMMERSLEMIVAILGILKSGGAYLPIDPGYPRERIEYMLKDSNARVLLSKDIEVIDLTKPTQLTYRRRAAVPTQPTQLCYIIYTSGSTGRPKGVMVEHRNLLAYIHAFYREFSITSGDTVIQRASFTFDAFVEETYPVLL